MSSATTKAGVADPGAAFCALTEDAVRDGNPDLVADEVLQRVFSAAVRLYAAKWENRARSWRLSATGR